MTKITCRETTEGHALIRTYEALGFTLRVASYDQYMTIRDSFDEPVATVNRPRHNQPCRWPVYLPTGECLADTAVGPRTAFRQFLIHMGH